MKFKIFTFLLLFVAFGFNSYATNPISPEAFDFEKSIKVDHKMNKATSMVAKFAQTKVGKWLGKKAIQAANVAQKLGLDLNDPVEKYLWYAILGVLAGTAVWIISAIINIGPLYYVGSLLWLAGVVSFWYWVYLKFLK